MLVEILNATLEFRVEAGVGWVPRLGCERAVVVVVVPIGDIASGRRHGKCHQNQNIGGM